MKTKDPLAGIYVNGEPVRKVIERQEIGEFEKERIKDEIAQRKSFYYGIKPKYEDEKQLKSKCGKVIHLSSEQIRKEYGVMNMPYKTRIENILWLLLNESPISAGAVSKEVNCGTREGSVAIGRIRKLIPDVIGIDKSVKPAKYFVVDSTKGFEEVYKLYKKRAREETANKKKRKGSIIVEQPSEDLRKRNLNIPEKIQITVDVNIRFGWIK